MSLAWVSRNNKELLHQLSFKLTLFPKLKLHSLRLPTSDVNGFGPSPNIGTIAFDTHIELLWVGDCHVSLNLWQVAR